ncbi:MAG: 16S rRNA (guanine(966)-N(2))-methyltransferase RsmD [Rhodobacteraceae bacterium]|nr:16S rRNA (guanine(966)-N(2))-methyltransferase RsmD [Paracoccaceae bacterium]
MRIISGRFRGTRLAELGKGDANAHLRPTSDRVRESLFSMLSGGRFGEPLAGARVLDLFAGTGALGLEALSRGAAHVAFVENGRKALGLIRENVAKCRADGETNLIVKDATRLGAGTPHDLVFLDPPYGKGLGEVALKSALAGGWLADDALVVWEESAEITPPVGFEILDQRRYGGSVISILKMG